MTDLKDHIVKKYLTVNEPTDQELANWRYNLTKDRKFKIEHEVQKAYVPIEEQIQKLLRYEALPPSTQLRVLASPAIPRIFIHDQLFLCWVEF